MSLAGWESSRSAVALAVCEVRKASALVRALSEQGDLRESITTEHGHAATLIRSVKAMSLWVGSPTMKWAAGRMQSWASRRRGAPSTPR